MISIKLCDMKSIRSFINLIAITISIPKRYVISIIFSYIDIVATYSPSSFLQGKVMEGD